MNNHYDFSVAERGKFYHADAEFHFPVYLESDHAMRVEIVNEDEALCLRALALPKDIGTMWRANSDNPKPMTRFTWRWRNAWRRNFGQPMNAWQIAAAKI